MSYKSHWQAQRLTALLLDLLYPCLLMVLYPLRDASYGEMIHAFSNPLFATLLAMTIAAALYHAVLGLQVIIEDYVKNATLQKFIPQILKIIGIMAFVFTLFSIVRIMILGIQL